MHPVLKLKFKMSIELHPRFRFVVHHRDEEKHWRCSAKVFGGRNLAKQYGVEMRLSSNEVYSSHVFHCDVSGIDETGGVFVIPDDQFKMYNKGQVELGDHNKDKSGEFAMPVCFKIIKKELN